MNRERDVLAGGAVDHDGVDGEGKDVHGRLEQWSDAPELVAPVMGVSIGVAKGRLHSAVGLAQRAPALVEEMRSGELDGYRASMVHAELDGSSPEVALGVSAVRPEGSQGRRMAGVRRSAADARADDSGSDRPRPCG